MISFQVNDMTCGHCVSSITKAVKALDSGATVQVDLSTHLVKIEATEADAAELSEAIKEAGYTPVAVEDTAVAPIAASAPAPKGLLRLIDEAEHEPRLCSVTAHACRLHVGSDSHKKGLLALR